MYTTIKKVGNVHPDDEVPVTWRGDSHKRLKEFPAGVRQNLGGDLRRVQDGLKPLDGGPMPGMGRSGVYELRDEDLGSWYRVIYLKKTKGVIYILHCFTKTSNQTSRQDVNTVTTRLAQLNMDLLEEEKDAKRRARNTR
jgi:phage-related protein